MTKDRTGAKALGVLALVLVLGLLLGFAWGRASTPVVHPDADQVSVVEAGGASGCCRATVSDEGGGAVIVPVTTANGRHTSGVVWTLSGSRYETYLGAGPILSDGGHWDSWRSCRWPLGGDCRIVHLRHYGGQVAPASVDLSSPSLAVVPVHTGSGGYCGHATSVNWISGLRVSLVRELPPNPRHVHSVYEDNVYQPFVAGAFRVHYC